MDITYKQSENKRCGGTTTTTTSNSQSYELSCPKCTHCETCEHYKSCTACKHYNDCPNDFDIDTCTKFELDESDTSESRTYLSCYNYQNCKGCDKETCPCKGGTQCNKSSCCTNSSSSCCNHKSCCTPKHELEVEENDDVPNNWWDQLPDFDPRVFDSIIIEQAKACVDYINKGLSDMNELRNKMESRKFPSCCSKTKVNVPRTKVIKPKEIIYNTKIDDFANQEQAY